VKLLSDSPSRYLYALTQMTIEKSRALGGTSELRICSTFANFIGGRPAKVGESIIVDGEPITVTEDFRESWRRDLPFWVVSRQWDEMLPHTRTYYKNWEPGACWRDKNKIRATADDMRRTLRLWRKAPPTNPNRRWLAGMVEIMRLCFYGLDEHTNFAAAIAATIGEGKYFAMKLRPIMLERAAWRKGAGEERPDITLPQLLDLISPP
jgi:hypothetical protein